ncbi:MAG: calcium/sodium antiporter [Spirochaetaceae bacterium]
MSTPVVLNLLSLLAGFILLYAGGHGLVLGASGVAARLRVPNLVIGLTVVAFGTSAPELFASVVSAWQGKMGVSVGNVLGSNIINIALVLGLSALFLVSPVNRRVIRFDMPFMFVTYAILLLVVWNTGGTPPWIGGVISTIEGVLLVVILVLYVAWLYRSAIAGMVPAEEIETGEVDAEKAATKPLWLLIAFIIIGIAALAGGAQLLVGGASWIAVNLFGAGERFIGIAIVALGTSLPELFTNIASLIKKEVDISIGNIIGSNIFNTLMVLGATSIVRNIEIGATNFSLDFLMMVLVSVVLFGSLLRRRHLSRLGGLFLLVLYVAYVLFLIETRGV